MQQEEAKESKHDTSQEDLSLNEDDDSRKKSLDQVHLNEP